MNDRQILPSIEDNLRRAIAQCAPPPEPDPISATPWIAMSLLQKAIRRGREALALRAAATLLRDDPARLWRRLGCIASEDVGLGSLAAVELATAALSGQRKRAALGGEWRVASCVIGELVRSPKCRGADDLLMACELHPAYAAERVALRGLKVAELTAIVASSAPIHRRALAFCYALGAGPRAFALTRRPQSQAQRVFAELAQTGPWPRYLVEVAYQGYRRTGEMLSPFVALLWREFERDLNHGQKVEADPFPPELMIGDVPGWAYDLYSREGRAVFARFLQTNAASARWIARHVRSARRIAFLGHIVFRVEGGLVGPRLRWALADLLRGEVDFECSGPECPNAAEILALVRQDLARLNEIRAQIVTRARE